MPLGLPSGRAARWAEVSPAPWARGHTPSWTSIRPELPPTPIRTGLLPAHRDAHAQGAAARLRTVRSPVAARRGPYVIASDGNQVHGVVDGLEDAQDGAQGLLQVLGPRTAPAVFQHLLGDAGTVTCRGNTGLPLRPRVDPRDVECGSLCGQGGPGATPCALPVPMVLPVPQLGRPSQALGRVSPRLPLLDLPLLPFHADPFAPDPRRLKASARPLACVRRPDEATGHGWPRGEAHVRGAVGCVWTRLEPMLHGTGLA